MARRNGQVSFFILRRRYLQKSKSQVPKSQASFKNQSPKRKGTRKTSFEAWALGSVWSLGFGICELAHQALEDIADECRSREGENPRPDDPLDDAPFHTAETLHRAHAHDGGGNNVCRRER